jgi:periplasmic divalent cation tolerance protein
MDRPLLVYTTFPDLDTGLSIGEALVRAKLVACANVWPGMRSVYSWKGAVERGEEAVGLLKTRVGLKEEVAAALLVQHPYETPIILYIEPTGGNEATLAWLSSETAARSSRGG